MVMINNMSLFEFKCRFVLSSVHNPKRQIFEFRELQPGKPGFAHECLRPTCLFLRAQTLQAELAASVRRCLYYV